MPHFDLDNKPEPRETTEMAEKPSVKEKPKPLWERPRVQIIGIAVLAVLGIAWQMSRNNDDRHPHNSQFATMSSISTPPTTPVTPNTDNAIQTQPPVSGTGTSPSDTSPGSPAASAPLAEQISQALDAQMIYSQKTREGVAVLSGRIDVLENNIAALQKRLETLTVAPATVPPPQAEAVKAVATATTTATKVKPVHKPAKKDKLKSAHIMSVYPGLAWITWQGSSWALRPGDKIADTTILHIDEKNRQVITANGIIK